MRAVIYFATLNIYIYIQYSDIMTFQHMHIGETARKYNLSPCIYMTSAGEYPCCIWKWTQVQSQGSITVGLGVGDSGTVSTACRRDMGGACWEGQEEAARKGW